MKQPKKTLHLNLTRKWFDMILSGEKKEEYRSITDYWERRLVNKEFDTITFSNGYATDRDQFEIELKGIKKGRGLGIWGAEAWKQYFVLELGSIVFEDIKHLPNRVEG